MEITQGKIRWIDIFQPGSNDLEWLREEFDFHPIILEELKDPSARARVENYERYLYLIYQFPVYDPIEKVSHRAEIDFLITHKEVITIRYDENIAIEDFKRQLENPDFHDKVLFSSLHFTYHLIDHVLGFNERQLHHIREKVEKISGQLFKNQEKEVLEEVSYVKRDLSKYKIIFEPQSEILRSLLENGENFWGGFGKPYLSALSGQHLKLINELEGYRTAIRDFESTNIQMMNVKTNEVLKTFTMLSFLTFPLSLVIGVFAMDAADTPLIHTPGAFWMFAAGIMLAIALMLTYFKGKKWL